MCCLFGMLDPERRFSGRQRTRIVHELASAAEVRGTDAAGVAYNTGGRLRICKHPLPGHLLRLRIPEDARTVMGHTRLATQGDQRHNRNNHPFRGRAGETSFALAHNGVLLNDRRLREEKQLPCSGIETDSFVAVQLLERCGGLSFDSLRRMAQPLEGSFSFTILDEKDNLYFVKGDSPLYICRFPETGAYLYASTEEILDMALVKIPCRLGRAERIGISCGELLCIDRCGQQSRSTFTNDSLTPLYPCSDWYIPGNEGAKSEYLQDLKSMAAWYGFSPEDIDALLADGFTMEELEEMLYVGEL